jgi:hypothetical protein
MEHSENIQQEAETMSCVEAMQLALDCITTPGINPAILEHTIELLKEKIANPDDADILKIENENLRNERNVMIQLLESQEKMIKTADKLLTNANNLVEKYRSHVLIPEDNRVVDYGLYNDQQLDYGIQVKK